MKKEYITPETKVVEAKVEGLLCASDTVMGNASFEDWQEDVLDW